MVQNAIEMSMKLTSPWNRMPVTRAVHRLVDWPEVGHRPLVTQLMIPKVIDGQPVGRG